MLRGGLDAGHEGISQKHSLRPIREGLETNVVSCNQQTGGVIYIRKFHMELGSALFCGIFIFSWDSGEQWGGKQQVL